MRGSRRVAMEYVPRNANPYVSRVDAGTIELVRAFGVEIVPSGDLIQRFEACWDDEQWAMHLEAARHTRSAFDVAFGFIKQRIRAGNPPRETEVVGVILEHFKQNRVICDHPPICAVGPNSGNPHYEPIAGRDAVVAEGSFVLIDLWAKCDRPRAVYSDLTRTAVAGREVPAKVGAIFAIVARSRDAAIATVRSAFAAGQVAARLAGGPGRPRRVSSRRATARRSAIAPAIPSARKCTATARTWTAWRRARNAVCCDGRASRSSRGFTCRSSACAARWTCSWTDRDRSTSPAAIRRRTCRRCWRKMVYVQRPLAVGRGACPIPRQAGAKRKPSHSPCHPFINPYFFIFLYSVTRLMPSALAARLRQ